MFKFFKLINDSSGKTYGLIEVLHQDETAWILLVDTETGDLVYQPYYRVVALI